MKNSVRLLGILLGSWLVMMQAGCAGGTGDEGDGGNDQDADSCTDRGNQGGDQAMTTPQLDHCHPGWKKQHCEQCHTLPVKNHYVDRVPECAGCHGGNGACLPKDPSPNHEHSRSDNCTDCHGQKHDFSLADDCVICHFADVGVVECQ